jgi:hypothetical protein
MIFPIEKAQAAKILTVLPTNRAFAQAGGPVLTAWLVLIWRRIDASSSPVDQR